MTGGGSNASARFAFLPHISEHSVQVDFPSP